MTELSRTAFFISDSTGITAESLGRALLTQFEFIKFHTIPLRFIHTPERARAAAARINQTAKDDKPLVFSTLTDPELRTIVQGCECEFFDLFDTFVTRMEQALDVQAVPTTGHSHGIINREQYFTRMDAVDYSLSHDDGSTVRQLDQADIILLGISRTGKTPTCLYMAMNYGVRAANFPITEDEMEELRLPRTLLPLRRKLFALTTSPQRLQYIRQGRRPNSRYASLGQCEFEIRQAETLYRRYNIPCIDTTAISIEEIAATIVDKASLERTRL